MLLFRKIVVTAVVSGSLLATACKKKTAPGTEGAGSGSNSEGAGSSVAVAPKGKASLGGKAGAPPFAPNTMGFKFQNYGNEEGIENLTAEEVKRMFGEEACAEELDGTCLLTPAAEQWMDEINKGMDGGHCEGLAAMALLFETGKLAPADFGGPTPYALALEGNSKLQREIAYWFSTQYVAPYSQSEIKTLTPNEVAAKLAEAFTTGKETYTLGIYQPDYTEGHATTPYAIVEKSPTETWILHYDNNFPGEERHIEIDRAANTWKYFTAADPKEPGSVYAGTATTHTLTIAPTSVRLAAMTCPFCGEVDDAADDAVRAKGSRQIILDGDADLLITDDTGKRLGHVGGKLVNEIAGAQIITMKSRVGHAEREPIYDIPTGRKLKVTLDGSTLKQSDETDVSLIAQGYTMGVYGVNLAPGHKDTIEFSADWKEISYTTDQDETPDLEIGIATLAADYEFEIHASGETGGQRIDVSLDVKAGTLSVEAHAKDGSATYEVEIHRISDAGEESFKHKGVAAGAKDRFVFRYADWKGNGQGMKVGIDHGDDGTIDEDEDITDEE